jgi:iron complex transport system substrate-binding protein
MKLAALGFFVVVVACRSGGPESEKKNWNAVPNAYATHFSLLRKDAGRRLIVFGHGGPTDTVTDLVLDTPLKHLAIISTTHAAFISALSGTDRIVACAQAKEVRDRDLRAAIDAGKVKDIGTANGLDREQLVAIKPDAVLGYPFGGEGNALKDLGIPVINVSEYLEEHPLGRAEWIRVFGVLLGKENEADSLFKGIVERYEAVRKSVPRDSVPTVLFGSVWQGQWWVPPGNSYMAKLIEDAGGRYIFADRRSDGNIAIDMETMISKGSDADYWGMIADIDASKTLGVITKIHFTGGDARLDEFEAVTQGHLFIGNTHTEDLFGQALLEPDRVLGDLEDVFHPGAGAVASAWVVPLFRSTARSRPVMIDDLGSSSRRYP